MPFKDFRDILIKNIINLPLNVTTNQLFNAPKSKDQKKKKRTITEKGQHFQEKVHSTV